MGSVKVANVALPIDPTVPYWAIPTSLNGRTGFSVAQIRRLLDTLRELFRVRLFETIDGSGPLTLMTDGRDVFGRTSNGDLFDLLRDPQQPMLMLGDVPGLRELAPRMPRSTRRKKRRSAKAG